MGSVRGAGQPFCAIYRHLGPLHLETVVNNAAQTCPTWLPWPRNGNALIVLNPRSSVNNATTTRYKTIIAVTIVSIKGEVKRDKNHSCTDSFIHVIQRLYA